MSIELQQIDSFTGPIAQLVPLINQLVLIARQSKTYEACMEVCAATRSAFMTIHHECTLLPDSYYEELAQFVTTFKTAAFTLGPLMADNHSVPQDQLNHLEGMISNISFRVLMLEALADSTKCIEERVLAVQKIGKDMHQSQNELRKAHGVETVADLTVR